MAKRKPVIVFVGNPPPGTAVLYRDEIIFMENSGKVFDLLRQKKVDLLLCEVASSRRRGGKPAVSLLQEVNRISPETRLALTNFALSIRSGISGLSGEIPRAIHIMEGSSGIEEFTELVQSALSGKLRPGKKIESKAWPAELKALQHTTGGPDGKLRTVSIQLLSSARTPKEREEIKGRLRSGWIPPGARTEQDLANYVGGPGEMSKREAEDLLIAQMRARGEPIPPEWLKKREKKDKRPKPRRPRG